jgi:hypothetical protein
MFMFDVLCYVRGKPYLMVRVLCEIRWHIYWIAAFYLPKNITYLFKPWIGVKKLKHRLHDLVRPPVYTSMLHNRMYPMFL